MDPERPISVTAPSLRNSDEDYKTIAEKAIMLQSKRQSAQDWANIWIHKGLEKKDNLYQCEVSLRTQTPTLSEREFESEVMREKRVVEFCGRKAHEELDRAEKYDAEYKENFEKYEDALKRYRGEQEKARLCSNCKKKLFNGDDDINAPNSGNVQKTTRSKDDKSNVTDSTTVPKKKTATMEESGATNSLNRKKEIRSDTDSRNEMVAASRQKRMRDYYDIGMNKESPKRQKWTKRGNDNHTSPDSVIESSSPDLATPLQRKQPWAAASLAKAQVARTAKKQQREGEAKVLEERIERPKAKRASSSSTQSEIALERIGVRAKVVVDTEDEEDEERLLLIVKGLGQWFESPKAKAYLSREV